MRILALLAALFFAVPAVAQTDTPPADAAQVPALAPFFKDGGTHGFYMGRAANLDGWFLTMSQNRVQIAYSTPDGQTLVIGALFGADGTNITEAQLVELRQHEPAVNKLFTDTVEQAQQRLVKTSGLDRVLGGLDPKNKGDQLYLDLAQAFHAQVGPVDAPLLFMIIDPNCPHCHKAWKQLAPLIAAAHAQLRVIPVGILGADSTRMAGKLLDTDQPGALWQQFADKDFDMDFLKGAPGDNGKAKQEVNRALFDRWNLKATPFFAYRSKSGGVKVLNQEPVDPAALVADLAPVAPPAPDKAPASPATPTIAPAVQ